MTPQDIVAFLISDDPDVISEEYAKMGTVEPKYKPREEEKEEDGEGSYGDSMAFIRGFVEKYQDVELDPKEIFDYIKRFTDK